MLLSLSHTQLTRGHSGLTIIQQPPELSSVPWTRTLFTSFLNYSVFWPIGRLKTINQTFSVQLELLTSPQPSCTHHFTRWLIAQPKTSGEQIHLLRQQQNRLRLYGGLLLFFPRGRWPLSPDTQTCVHGRLYHNAFPEQGNFAIPATFLRQNTLLTARPEPNFPQGYPDFIGNFTFFSPHPLPQRSATDPLTKT